MKLKSLLQKCLLAAFVCGGVMAGGLAHAHTNIVSTYLTGTHNWYRTNVYQLNGMVFLRSNAVLHIEAGTVIKGRNLTPVESTNVAALIVCRGAKIFAEGTPQNPIIFTAEEDDTTIPDDMPIWGPLARGRWGGVVVLGKTTINSAINVAGQAADPKYEVYEGLPDVIDGGEALLRFGGTDDNDDSGILRYVSIRHGGATLFQNREINGLSMGAVGRGTTIEFVEAYAIADDGFEFFGGTVNTRYLVSAFNDDDSFDTDMGFRGTNQFWFGIQSPDKRNYGMELNNQVNEVGQTTQLTPASDFKVYNFTMIGAGALNPVGTGGGGNNAAIALRSWAGPKIYNSIFTDFNERGILLDTQNGNTATQAVTGGFAQLHNTLWWDFVTGSGNGIIDNTATNLGRNSLATNYWTDTSLSNQIVNPLLTSISRTNIGAFLDPRPAAGSPAYSDVAATPNGFLTPVNYRGAFGSNDLWINGWTALAEYGILAPAGQHTNIVSTYLTGTHNWYRTNVYQLNGMVFLRSNAVLHIEAGTVIKGRNLTPVESTNVAALIVCRGAKIFAEGTPQNPIIFTAEEDDTTIPDDMPIWGPLARGRWGGVVVLGKTTINSAINVAGQAADPKYEVYEGLPDVIDGGEALLRFGGTDDNDNSGILRYVSIRHGGATLFQNREINGLSMGAVGRGTTIEFVEAYAIADDGFEFFGGTVNTRYLVSAFNDDDSFDTDMGFRGTNQFWFGIQSPDKRNYGMELNNQVNEVGQTTQLTPASDFKVYNFTMIGAGALNPVGTGGGGNNAAIALRSWAGPKIYNSIFTDFNERGILLDTQNGNTATQAVTGGFAQLHNTLWWDFVTGSGNGIIDNTATNLGRNSLATNYWTDTSLSNQIVNPLLTSISRTNVGAFLDPRPAAGSPANSGAAETPGGLVAANYQGAFGPGRSSWISDWTALSEYSVVGGAGGYNPRGVTATNAVAPNRPFLVSAIAGGGLAIAYATQAGFSYQLQSTTNLAEQPVIWANEGAATPGTGGMVTNSMPGLLPHKLFRILAQ